MSTAWRDAGTSDVLAPIGNMRCASFVSAWLNPGLPIQNFRIACEGHSLITSRDSGGFSCAPARVRLELCSTLPDSTYLQ
jgi:hypothetical protein